MEPHATTVTPEVRLYPACSDRRDPAPRTARARTCETMIVPPPPHAPARLRATTARIGEMKIRNLRLQTTQGRHPDKHLILYGCQQLAVKVAESLAEGLPLDWVRVDLQRVALQGQDEDAAAM